jgi:uncharacterized protein (DUF2267 family)
MSALGLKIIDESVQQANIWFNEVDYRTGWDNKQRSYRLLRAVLHALRDHMNPDEAAQLSAQLPILIRGIYYGPERGGRGIGLSRRGAFRRHRLGGDAEMLVELRR